MAKKKNKKTLIIGGVMVFVILLIIIYIGAKKNNDSVNDWKKKVLKLKKYLHDDDVGVISFSGYPSDLQSAVDWALENYPILQEDETPSEWLDRQASYIESTKNIFAKILF